MQGANSTSDPQRVARGWTHTQSRPSRSAPRQLSCIMHISAATPSTEEESRRPRGPLSSTTGADPGLWGPSDTHPHCGWGEMEQQGIPSPEHLGERNHHVAGALGEQAQVRSHQWAEEPGHNRGRGRRNLSWQCMQQEAGGLHHFAIHAPGRKRGGVGERGVARAAERGDGASGRQSAPAQQPTLLSSLHASGGLGSPTQGERGLLSPPHR